MALVPAKCTNCGANIEVDESKEAGICRYCGTAFITEKAINNYTTNVQVNNNVVQTTNINAGTVHIHEDQLNRFFVVEEGYLIDYKGKRKKVTIPEGIIGIAEDAFNTLENRAAVEEVLLSPTVVEIQDEAFGDLWIHTIVRIPENTQLQVVGKKGFGCNAVVVVPPSVLSIAKGAFEWGQVVCYHGSKEAFVQKYGKEALLTRLAGAKADEEAPFFENCKGVVEKKDGTKYAFNDKETLLIDCKMQDEKKYVLPTEVDGRKITGYSMRLLDSAKQYETVVFPEGITALPDKMFEICGNIKYLYLPKSLKHIGKANFTWTNESTGTGLRSIEFAEGCDLDEWVDIRFLGTCLYEPPKVRGVRRPATYRVITVHVDRSVNKSVWLRPSNMPMAPYLTRALRGGDTFSECYSLTPKYLYIEGGSWTRLRDKSPLTVYVKKGFFGYKIIQK